MSNRQLYLKSDSRIIKPIIYAGLVIILAIIPLFIKSQYFLEVSVLTFIYIVAAASLRVILISGQTSLAHAAFMGIGAYTSGVLAKELGLTPWVCIPIGALVTTAIGIIVALIFSRIRALLFGMLTIFFGMAILYVIQSFSKWTGGSAGIMGIPPLFGVAKMPYYYFFLGITVVSLLALYRFEFCRIGKTMKTLDQSYMVAASVGINEVKTRVLAVAIGSFFVGLIGAAYAHYIQVLSPASFGVLQSIYLVMYVLIGGLGSFAGPIIGTSILIIIPEAFRGLKGYSPFIFAGLLLIINYTLPQGLVGLPKLVMSRLRHKSKGGTHAP